MRKDVNGTKELTAIKLQETKDVLVLDRTECEILSAYLQNQYQDSNSLAYPILTKIYRAARGL
jgi:hypothetical protein